MDKLIVSDYTVLWDKMIGNRAEQQDAMDIMLLDGNCCATICDGMGGLYSGSTASSEAVLALHRLVENAGSFREPLKEIPAFLENALQHLDFHISSIQVQDRMKRSMGTTVVTAILWEGMLFWMSVGDSRLYIFRDDELIQATRDHNYSYTLKQLYAEGMISEPVFRSELERGDALTSYIGMNGVAFYDVCKSPFRLRDGDIVLLVSDGIYKTINDAQIREILSRQVSLEEKAEAFVSGIIEASQSDSQDNASFIMIEWGLTSK